MQFYDLKTVDEPTAAQADALHEVRSRGWESLARVEDAKAEQLGFRIGLIAEARRHDAAA